MKTRDNMKVKRDLIKKLRNRISSLEKSLENITKLVGKDNISLLRKDKRMKDFMSSIELMFQEEGKKNSELNAKAISVVKKVELGMISGPLNTASFYRVEVPLCMSS